MIIRRPGHYWLALLALPLCVPAIAAERPVVGYTLVTSSAAARHSSRFGRVEALRQVDLRSRVSGTLARWLVSEGEQVEQDQLLVEIDPSVYQANVRAARAEVTSADATLELARLEQQRLETLQRRNAVSRAEVDAAVAMRRGAEAALEAAKAMLELRQIDLNYTRMSAPFAGKIGTFARHQGSYLEGNTVLTSLVQVDPVRVAITVSETEFINYRRQLRAADTTVPQAPVSRELLLADGSRYQHPGKMMFAGNELIAETATLPLYLEFPNPEGLLTPGQFVSVITRRERGQALPSVPLASIVSDARGDYVLVIDEDETVARRDVDIADRTAGLALLNSGLISGERVIIQGLTRVRVGERVSGERVDEAEH